MARISSAPAGRHSDPFEGSDDGFDSSPPPGDVAHLASDLPDIDSPGPEKDGSDKSEDEDEDLIQSQIEREKKLSIAPIEKMPIRTSGVLYGKTPVSPPKRVSFGDQLSETPSTAKRLNGLRNHFNNKDHAADKSPSPGKLRAPSQRAASIKSGYATNPQGDDLAPQQSGPRTGPKRDIYAVPQSPARTRQSARLLSSPTVVDQKVSRNGKSKYQMEASESTQTTSQSPARKRTSKQLQDKQLAKASPRAKKRKSTTDLTQQVEAQQETITADFFPEDEEPSPEYSEVLSSTQETQSVGKGREKKGARASQGQGDEETLSTGRSDSRPSNDQDIDLDRLFLSQHENFEKIFQIIEKVGIIPPRKDEALYEEKTKVKPPQVAAAKLSRKLRDTIIGKYFALGNHNGNELEAQLGSLDEQLLKVMDLVQPLHPDKVPGVMAKNLLLVDMYSNIIPDLVAVLKASLDYHSQPQNVEEVSDGPYQLSTIALKELLNLASLIITVYQSGKKYSEGKLAGYHFVIPLRTIFTLLNKTIIPAIHAELLKREEEEQERNNAARNRIKKAREEIRRQQLREIQEQETQRKRNRDALYLARRHVERALTNDRARHLAQPEDEPSNIKNFVEYDANGQPYKRIEMFKKREDFSNQYWAQRYERVEEEEWTNEQEHALILGLQEFSGPNVYVEIFNNYCSYDRELGGYGPLRPFNVRQILSKAAYIRHCALKKETEDEQKEGLPSEDKFVAEQWIRDIEVLDY